MKLVQTVWPALLVGGILALPLLLVVLPLYCLYLFVQWYIHLLKSSYRL
mgnify:CR=1 FL=1